MACCWVATLHNRNAEVCCAKHIHAKCTQVFRFTPCPRIPQHVGPQRYARAKHIHAKCTQAFRFTPSPKFRNMSGGPQQVCTRKTHTRKMHTSVPVCSGLPRPKIPQHFGPQRSAHAKRIHAKCTQAFRSAPVSARPKFRNISGRTGLHTQNAHTQNAHKRSGLFRFPPAPKFRNISGRTGLHTQNTQHFGPHTAQKRIHAKCTQAFRSVPVSARPKIPQHFGPHRSAHAKRIHAKCTQAFRSVPVSARPKIPQHFAARCRTGLHTQNAYTQNAHKRSGLFRFPPAPKFLNISQPGALEREIWTPKIWWLLAKTHTRKMHTSVPVCSGFRPPQNSATFRRCRTGLHTQNAYTQNAHKRSGLFRFPPAPKFRNISGRTGLHTQNAYTQNAHKRSGLFRFPPAPKFLNISQPGAAQVCTRKTHTRKMHTSVPVCSGFRPPQNSSTFRSPVPHRSAHAKRIHAKCTQAFRSVPVSARPKIPQHFAARCRTGLHTQNAYTQNAHKRSGLFRFPPAPKFLNISQPGALEREIGTQHLVAVGNNIQKVAWKIWKRRDLLLRTQMFGIHFLSSSFNLLFWGQKVDFRCHGYLRSISNPVQLAPPELKGLDFQESWTCVLKVFCLSMLQITHLQTIYQLPGTSKQGLYAFRTGLFPISSSISSPATTGWWSQHVASHLRSSQQWEFSTSNYWTWKKQSEPIPRT